jgi:HAD superfamily hydrolase (TIGR01509 family)
MLLDFDGVLADSEPMFRRSWNTALEPWGHSIPRQDYWKYWSSLGHGLEGEIERKNLDSIDPELARQRQKRAYMELVAGGEVPLFPGAVELIKNLRTGERWRGRPFCIASNTPSEIVRRILIDGGASVPEVVGGEGMRKKPFPDIFISAAERLGVSPERTLVLEDSWKGISAADAGGFVGILVLNPYNSDLEIESRYRVDGIREVLDLLGNG